MLPREPGPAKTQFRDGQQGDALSGLPASPALSYHRVACRLRRPREPALTALQSFFATVGAAVIGLCQSAGAITLFMASTLRHLVTPPFYPTEFGRQLLRIGYNSLPVVGLTTLFTGGALALQIYAGGTRFGAETVVPSIVAIGMTRELGPVLCGLMVAGRVSASIAAELGTMRVTEQIDALTTLSTNPMKYLVAPRVLAATLTLPVLALIGDIIGIYGAFLVGVHRLGFNPTTFLQTTWDFLTFWDVTSGLVKAAVFGFIVALIGCYQGYNSARGAQGVGQATRTAVVQASILILAANFIMTDLFFS